MLIPIIMPRQKTPLWMAYLTARALGARLVARGYRLYLEVQP